MNFQAVLYNEDGTLVEKLNVNREKVSNSLPIISFAIFLYQIFYSCTESQVDKITK